MPIMPFANKLLWRSVTAKAAPSSIMIFPAGGGPANIHLFRLSRGVDKGKKRVPTA